MYCAKMHCSWSPERLRPGQGASLIRQHALQYHNEKSNLELTELLQARQCAWQQMRTMQRVREGVKLRLEMNIPYIGMWSGHPA